MSKTNKHSNGRGQQCAADNALRDAVRSFLEDWHVYLNDEDAELPDPGAMERALTPAQPQHYLLHIWGDVEPQLHGPFATPNERDAQARDVRHADPDLRDGVYWLDLGARLEVGPYPAAELEAGA